jgi:hypothetical protein
MEKISVRCCVDLGFNDLSGIFLTAGYKVAFIASQGIVQKSISKSLRRNLFLA